MSQATVVKNIQLFLYVAETGQYQEYGTVGAAIIGTAIPNAPAAPPAFKVGCYNNEGSYLCTAPVTANNDTGAQLALQGNGYISLKDEDGKLWSLLFESDAEAIEFGGAYATAMYCVSGSPESHIVSCDAGQGKADKPLVFGNDKVKVRFTSWVVQKSNPRSGEFAKLGSQLEGNEGSEKPYAYTVPMNHSNVTDVMKGFEGMSVGMAEEGRRFVVIPDKSKKGSGPSVHMCHYVHVVKRKDDEPTPGGGNAQQHQQQQQFQNQQQMGMGMMNNNGGMMMNQQQPQGQLALMGGPGMMMPQQQQGNYQLALQQPEPQKEIDVTPIVIKTAPPPPPGFNAEQMAIVDRMREQISQLQGQLKEATAGVDMFSHDFRVEEEKRKPQSLASAQIEHSVKILIQESEDGKDELEKKDVLLKQVEEKNKQLQQKLDKFSNTAQQLSDDKKTALTSGTHMKLEMDQEMLKLENELSRIMSEREDLARHLSTVKKLLAVSDGDVKTEKGKLKVAEVNFQTAESKLASTEEQFQEERSRRKLLEGKVVTLGDELRQIMEEFRTKEGQIEERKRKMDADKLHYTTLMDEERGTSQAEMRMLREELVEELQLRDRRYQEERQRVSTESFERGRRQGIEDGESEALLESDAKLQQYTLEIQRNKSEVEALRIRSKQVSEQAESDSRRLEAQILALTTVVDDLNAQNTTSDVEIQSLQASISTIEGETIERIGDTIKQLTRPVGRKDLLTLIHRLRMHLPVDYTFENERAEQQQKREDGEREEVLEWVRDAMTSDAQQQVGPPPYMRTKAPPEGDSATLGAPMADEEESVGIAALDPSKASSVVVLSDGKEVPMHIPKPEEIDPAQIEARYKEILSAIDDENPDLELAGKKKKKEKTPEPEPEPEKAAEATAVQQEEEEKKADHQEQQEEEEEERAPVAQQQQQDEEDADETEQQQHAAPAEEDDQDDDKEDEKQPAAQIATHEEEQQQQPANPGGFADSDNEEEQQQASAPAPAQKKAAPPKPSNNKRTMFDDSEGDDDDGDDDADVTPAVLSRQAASATAPSSGAAATNGGSSKKKSEAAAAPKGRAAPKSMFDDSDDDDDDDNNDSGAGMMFGKRKGASHAAAPASAPAAKKSSAGAAPKKSMFDDDGDDDSDGGAGGMTLGRSAAKAPAKKAATKRAVAPPKKSMFDDSDED